MDGDNVSLVFRFLFFPLSSSQRVTDLEYFEIDPKEFAVRARSKVGKLPVIFTFDIDSFSALFVHPCVVLGNKTKKAASSTTATKIGRSNSRKVDLFVVQVQGKKAADLVDLLVQEYGIPEQCVDAEFSRKK